MLKIMVSANASALVNGNSQTIACTPPTELDLNDDVISDLMTHNPKAGMSGKQLKDLIDQSMQSLGASLLYSITEHLRAGDKTQMSKKSRRSMTRRELKTAKQGGK